MKQNIHPIEVSLKMLIRPQKIKEPSHLRFRQRISGFHPTVFLLAYRKIKRIIQYPPIFLGSFKVSVKPPGLIDPGRETHNQDIQFNEQASGAYPGSRPFAQSSFVRSRVGAVRRTQTRYL